MSNSIYVNPAVV